jgi:hypothetical protein
VPDLNVMGSEQRKSPRKLMGANGFLYEAGGQPIGPCQVENVSLGGAMLTHVSEHELPAEFVLSLSRNGKVRRQCQIAWRAMHRVGVRFLPPQG